MKIVILKLQTSLFLNIFSLLPIWRSKVEHVCMHTHTHIITQGKNRINNI